MKLLVNCTLITGCKFLPAIVANTVIGAPASLCSGLDPHVGARSKRPIFLVGEPREHRTCTANDLQDPIESRQWASEPGGIAGVRPHGIHQLLSDPHAEHVGT
jgi:hypothetical protein